MTRPSLLPTSTMQVVLPLLLLCPLTGCSRTRYRQAADNEAYGLIASRQIDPRWTVPRRPVEPSRVSRMFLATERDCGPKPPDDPAAHRYMVRPDQKEIPYYQQIPSRGFVENPVWLDVLPREEDGSIQLAQPLAIDLGLLNSRDYQDEYERVYLAALDLSGDRFEFDTQWFAGIGTDFTATGSDLGGTRLLGLSDRFGFTRSLAGGGQFATDVLNSLSWDYGNGGVQSGSAAVIMTFTQPLLRGAFRHVRLESLTQTERNLLYRVRDFARFRRLFYVDITERYLGLLTQLQAIRNTESNVENLRQNLIEHQFYSLLEIVSQVQVDTVFQQYQNGRRNLLSARQNLIASEDQFKFTLGLPSWIQFEIDESLLKPFELVDPRLEQLQTEAQQLFEQLVQVLPPERAPLETLKQHYEAYLQLRERVAVLLPEVERDMRLWRERLSNVNMERFSEDDQLDYQQQVQLADQIEESLIAIRNQLRQREAFNTNVLKKLIEYETNPPTESVEENQQAIEEILQGVESFEDLTLEDILPNKEDDTAIAAWKSLEEAIGSQLREEIAELYVAQTQIRLFLIDIEPRQITSEAAITFAHQNRLDLMNSKALVMDAFRRVEVAADALESDLDVSGQVRLGSDANSNSPFKLDSANNTYTVGVQFDGPLNRLNERNVYRASQIAYQQASRSYIASKDQIANEVRQILRRLEFSRLSFQIARQQVVAATRQVDEAQIALRQSRAADANLTLILLDALQGMLDAKNSLIGNWVEYRVQRMRLFAALDMLYLDERGNWINMDTGLDVLEGPVAIDPEYFPPQWFDRDRADSYETVPPPPLPPPPVASDTNGTESGED